MTHAFNFNVPPLQVPSILPLGVTLHPEIKIVQVDATKYEVLDMAVRQGRRHLSLGIFCKTQAVRVALNCSTGRFARDLK